MNSLPNLLEALKKVYPKLKHNAIIIDLLSFDSLSAKDLLAFLALSHTHSTSGQSFVLVSPSVSYDELPEELNVVPTLQEAKDLIAMEDIARDLEM